MLGNYNAVGIGHVYFNGTHYWVQEFGYSGTAAQTVANDSETTVEMNVLNSNITAVSVTPSADTCSLYVENSVELPTVTAKMKLTDTWPASAFPVEIAYEWTSANSQVAKIENNALYGVSVGDTTISAVALGNTVSVSVSVKANATEEANKNATGEESIKDATGEEAIKDASKNANKDENKNVSDNEDANENEKLSLGQEVSYKNANYVITGIGTNEKTVAYQKADNTKAKKIKIPSDITIDGIKYKVTAVSANAFKKNKQVTSITIPSSVEKIGKNAFSGCKKLKTIIIKTNKLTSSGISKNAFKGVPNSTVVKVAKNKVKKYAKLFRKKGLSKKIKVQSY
jgi:hypothetical protein